VYELIASPFLGDHLLVRPGSASGLKVPVGKYLELERLAAAGRPCPDWLLTSARRAWDVDLAERELNDAVLVRPRSPHGYGRASYELNLGCNYDCEHCYLGLKKFEGLGWPDREKLLHIMRDAGVLWLQLTGGEPLIDKLFPDTYRLAHDLGMMLSISSNGSRLSNTAILDVLLERRPYRLTLSVYGATADSYDGLTRRPGAFAKFTKGLTAAHEAGLPINLNLVVANQNAHEVDAMKTMAEQRGLPYMVYVNMSPTIQGTGDVLVTQSEQHLRKRKVFTGCNAGHTFFHVDPHGRASICKVGREPNVPLIEEGVDGLHRLGAIADSLMLRTGGCSGCALSGTCWTCRPLAKLYQDASAPLRTYCQHGEGR